MNFRKLIPLVIVLSTATLSGCAAYRTSSNIKTATAAANASAPVIVTETALPDRKYTEIGLIDISVKKLTLFHADPTKEKANEALMEKARAIGADAVINVTYKTGIGLTTWGYIDAQGMGVKFSE